ncbi:nitrilase-related carbon-nitrogen hydrolase [Pseudomonas putida]
MTTAINVAAVQFEPTLFEKPRNLQRLADLVEQAARGGAQLIVTPEMGTTGYCWQHREEVAPYVETIPGATTERFTQLARQYGCHIVIGMPEVDPLDDLYYNSAVLIGPDGVVGKHRKTHPYISEPKWAASGDLGHQVFDTPIGRIALLICMDIHFLETARIVGLGGADVICHISNWLAERTPAPYWINRAFENGCYLVESNRWGHERGVQFSGGSCVIEPDGKVQGILDTCDGVLFGQLDLARVRDRQPQLLARRRPSLYKELAQPAYAWNPLDFFGLYGLSPRAKGKCSKVAVGQFASRPDPVLNLQTMARQAAHAKAQGAELVVFPELALSGPYADRSSALTLDGPQVRALLELAIELRLHIIAGLVLAEGDALFNSAVVVGPEGIVGHYHKLHLGVRDNAWATPGSAWKTIDLPLGRVGLLIGDDCLVPEAGRVLSLRGCDLIACPAALSAPVPGGHPGTRIAHPAPIPTGADPYHWHLGRVRAGENNLYLAFANSQDPALGSFGASGVFGPDTFAFPRQEVLVTREHGVGVAGVDTSNLDSPYPTNVVRRKDLVVMRQVQQYGALWRPQ